MVDQPTPVDDAGSVPGKSTLFCPVCAHESRVDGDWLLRTRGDRLAYVCPDCGTAVTERPAGPDAPALGSASGRAANALGRFVAASAAAWRETVAISAETASSVVRPLR